MTWLVVLSVKWGFLLNWNSSSSFFYLKYNICIMPLLIMNQAFFHFKEGQYTVIQLTVSFQGVKLETKVWISLGLMPNCICGMMKIYSFFRAWLFTYEGSTTPKVKKRDVTLTELLFRQGIMNDSIKTSFFSHSQSPCLGWLCTWSQAQKHVRNYAVENIKSKTHWAH